MEIKSTPDFVFESSWEVCNKVGGIYTVLSTKAYTLQQKFNDNLLFIGPDIWNHSPSPYFKEDPNLFSDWQKQALKENLKIRVGRWDVPGNPPVVLVDFTTLATEKDMLYFSMWEDFKVNSIHAYGDYDDSCLFAYATGKIIESFYKFHKMGNKNVAALFNEWMLGMGALYIQKHVPQIATLFTTHATTIGRSIAGNGKALYAYMEGYHGDQMAQELNVEAKHSIEKQAAHHVDCFTTVSDITALECKQLLDKQPDIVTPNGFEPNFVPSNKAYETKRVAARKKLIEVTEKLLGYSINPEALLISTSGRYEYRNKGIDVFIEAVNRIRTSGELQRDTIAFIMVPAWTKEVRNDLKYAIEKDYPMEAPMQCPFITHWLHDMDNDNVLKYIYHCGFKNTQNDKLKIIFVPCYQDGNDGIFNMPYYDLLIGMDATVYPSYYEPWGYTPLESIAFGIPTITTDLAGFGMWAKKIISGSQIKEGVVVAPRTDFNYFDVAENIKQNILLLSKMNNNDRNLVKENCFKLAAKAQWSQFIDYYFEAFEIAFKNRKKRLNG